MEELRVESITNSYLQVPDLMGCEAKHIAIIKNGGAFHGHIGGHVLQVGAAENLFGNILKNK